MPTRARPLPPDERRAALVAATLPLLSEHGRGVSTRQIADAAGVAEGTIYRAFPDKESLISATLASALDPSPMVRRLAALDPDAPFVDRLRAAVVILQERLSGVFELIAAFGPPGAAASDARDRLRHAPPHQLQHHHAETLEALAEVFAPDVERLRMPPAECARLLRLVVFAGSHPRITDGDPLSTDDIVDLLLHGIACRPDQQSAPSGGRRC